MGTSDERLQDRDVLCQEGTPSDRSAAARAIVQEVAYACRLPDVFPPQGPAPALPAGGFNFLTTPLEQTSVWFYSKGLTEDYPSGTAPVNAIGFCHPVTRHRIIYSCQREARLPDVQTRQARNAEYLERRVLERFFGCVGEFPGVFWIAWSTSAVFGPDHLVQRLRELGGKYCFNSVGLGSHFEDHYGPHYVPDPPRGKFCNLAILNGFSLQGYLDKDAAAAAYKLGNHAAIEKSLDVKVGWMDRFYKLHRQGHLKVSSAICAGRPIDALCRIIVMPDWAIAFDGQPVTTDMDSSMQEDAVRLLTALIAARGAWRTSTELVTTDGNLADIRLDRLWRRLPPCIKDLIDSCRKKGYRLKAGAWSPPLA